MKKIIVVLMCALLMFAMSVPSFAEAAEVPVDPTPTGHIFMTELMTAGTEILATLLKTALMLLGAWLASVMGKYIKLKHLNAATEEVIKMTITTVGELQQTYVDGWKAASVNGKLTDAQKQELNAKLLLLTKEKLTKPLVDLLRAAAVDINELISGAGEDFINGRDPFEAVEDVEDLLKVKGVAENKE